MSKLIKLLKAGADVVESPPLNARLLLGFPDTTPTVWVNDELQSEAESEKLSRQARKSRKVETVEFRGANGLTYYRHTLKKGGAE